MSVQRVALVSPYALSVFGGAQEQVLAMSRELSRRGRDVLIVAPDARDARDYDTPAHVLRFGAKWSVPANGSRAPLTLSPAASMRARAALKAFRPDVVHFHEPFAPLLGWSSLHAHEHAALGTFHRSGDGPALRYGRVVMTRLATGLDGAVSVSDAAARTLRRACGLESVVLFNGLETARFVESPRERAAERTLLYVGRLEERKGVETAIEALRLHNESGGDLWRLVVAGDGPLRERLQTLASGERVVFVGAVTDEVKRSWLRRVDALVAPSMHGESFGLVLLEGMASETLVVASDLEGYREAAGGHATLFVPGDATSLEAAITRAFTSESDAGIERARHHAEAWSMARLMDAYDERYDAALERFQAAR
jgi:phosphatidyl-myo-inositol alpha-mannosyltransferase